MMRLLYLNLSILIVAINGSFAVNIVYVTDLPQFSSLAPCGQSAVSAIIQDLTNSECPAPVTDLESCACTKNQNAAAVQTSISSRVFYNCGTTATDDVGSASLVFSNYCNQAAAATMTAAPASNTISQFITDLQAFSYLAPCAASGLSNVVMDLTNNACPTGASALASCACSKNQNSLAASESINSRVFYDCGSTHTEDVTSAEAVFAGYCGLGAGTTAFPTPSNLPGAVTYYITDMPLFSSLAPCAQSAVSNRVLDLTNEECPSDPRQLVSCACVKDQNSQMLSASIASEVTEYCGSTATADVSSGQAVFAYYCSAGKGLVTPNGITASVTATTGAGGIGGGSATSSAGVYYSFGPSATGSSTVPVSGSSGGGSGKGVPMGAIVGGAVGGGLFIILILFSGWYFRRPKTPRPLLPMAAAEAGGSDSKHDFSGKAELANTVSPAGSSAKSPIQRKPAPAVRVRSPVSPLDEKPKAAEMPSPPAPNRAEVPGGPDRSEVSGDREAQELHNENRNPYFEVHGSQQHPSELAGPQASMSGPFEMPHPSWE